MSVVSAQPYQLEEDGDNYDVVAVAAYTFNYTVDYKMPPEYVRTDPYKWYVAAGYDSAADEPEVENITSTAMHNSTHTRFRVWADWNGGNGRTRWYVSNGGNYVSVKNTSNNNDATGSVAGSSAESVLYDNNYNTGRYGGSTLYVGCDLSGGCTQPRVIASSIFEESVYWDIGGEQVDVTFIIKDELNKFLQDANVTITRVVDGVSLGSELSDLSGQVEFTLADDLQYQINVTKQGYDNYSGIITVIDTSYQIIMVGESSQPFSSIFETLSIVTSPTNPVEPELVNFTMQISDTNNSLDFWGLTTTFNGTTYTHNSTNATGGIGNLTVNLTDHNGETITIVYFFNVDEYDTFYFANAYRITSINTSGSALTDIDEEFGDDLGVLGKLILATVALVVCIVVLAGAGVPSEGAAAASIVLVDSIAMSLGWMSTTIGGLVILVTVGLAIIASRRGV